MEYTTNYNLKKPEGTDPVLVGDLNDNADIIDTALESKINEPSNEGTNGQVLATDGNGGRFWKSVEGGSLPVGTNNGDILVWNGTQWVAKQPSRLPNGYQEVEYIESTGTQYIDTELSPTNNFKIEAEVEMPEVTAQSDYNLFGSYKQGTYSCYVVGGYNSKYHTEYGSTEAHFFSNTSFVGKTKITYDNGNITLADSVNSESADLSAHPHVSSDVSFFVFAGHNTSIPSPYIQGKSSFKLFSFAMWIDGLIARWFIPCYHKDSGAIGLYDTVNMRFYQNAGTGTFLKGNDVN